MGARRKKHISKGNCMGRSLLPPLPSNSLISPTQDDDDDAFDAFDAFDQDYNEAGLKVYGSSSNY